MVGGVNWEIGIDIYTLSVLCRKERTNETLLYVQNREPLSVLCCAKMGRQFR